MMNEKIAELQGTIDAYQMSENEANEIIAELKAENEALIEGLGIVNKYVNKYHKTLQEIKTTAEQSNVDCIYRISVIRKILTKAEEEWK